jgi:hypothetical protein
VAKAKKETVPVPVQVFVDTCVWLDMAGNEANEPLLGAIESLCGEKVIELVVPQIVRDEFDRNKGRIVKESGKSLSSAIKRSTVALWKYGDPRRRRKAVEVLQDIDYRLVHSVDVTAEAVERLEKLFALSSWRGDIDAATRNASARALKKKAPFHSGKNSFAAAVIIEMYAQLAGSAKGRCVFVTHNVKDFSLPSGDQRLPHPDIAACFTKIKSRYFIKLVDALRALRPHEFAEAMYEHEFTMEFRKASEISAAVEELTDRVWYDRHMVTMWKVQTGKCKVIPKKEFGPKYYRASARDKVITDDVLAGAQKAARRLEKKYGKNNLGPYSKFEWGMINGKLSALRWVFGEEWDELYT